VREKKNMLPLLLLLGLFGQAAISALGNQNRTSGLDSFGQSQTVFSLPIGNRRLPPIFTDTATRRQPIPAVNFEKFRPNLKFSKIFEIKKEKIW